jgi:hypothetical protein
MAKANEKFYSNRGSLTPINEPSFDVRLEVRNRYRDGVADGILLSLNHGEPIPNAGYKYTELFVSMNSHEAFALLTALLGHFNPKK